MFRERKFLSFKKFSLVYSAFPAMFLSVHKKYHKVAYKAS